MLYYQGEKQASDRRLDSGKMTCFLCIYKEIIKPHLVRRLSAATYRELADNPGFELGTHLKAATQKIHPRHPGLTQRFHSTLMLPYPGRDGSNSETKETLG